MKNGNRRFCRDLFGNSSEVLQQLLGIILPAASNDPPNGAVESVRSFYRSPKPAKKTGRQWPGSERRACDAGLMDDGRTPAAAQHRPGGL
jgi:hypothetical protein